MDYNISLLDITRAISTYIIHKKEKVDYLSYFFYNILFAETLNEDEIDEFTLNYGFNTEKFSDFIYMGIGSICSSLIDVRHSYLKSMRSIALCTDEMRIIDYEELGFPRLLLGTIAEEELVEYAKHTLEKVKDHDKKFQTDFLKTMKSYILHNGNINKTSAELYIHRNINFSIF